MGVKSSATCSSEQALVAASFLASPLYATIHPMVASLLTRTVVLLVWYVPLAFTG